MSSIDASDTDEVNTTTSSESQLSVSDLSLSDGNSSTSSSKKRDSVLGFDLINRKGDNDSGTLSYEVQVNNQNNIVFNDIRGDRIIRWRQVSHEEVVFNTRPDGTILAVPVLEYEQGFGSELSSESDDSWEQEYSVDLIAIQHNLTLTEVMYRAFDNMVTAFGGWHWDRFVIHIVYNRKTAGCSGIHLCLCIH